MDWTHRVKHAEIKQEKKNCWGWKSTHSSGKCKGNTPLLPSSTLGKLWLRSPWWMSAPEGCFHLQPVPFILTQPPLFCLALSSGLFTLARSHFRLRFRADWSVTSRVYVNVCDKKAPPPTLRLGSLSFLLKSKILLSVFIFTAEGMS